MSADVPIEYVQFDYRTRTDCETTLAEARAAIEARVKAEFTAQ